MEKKIKLLIADDHAIMREGLVTLLRFQKDFSVIGEATNGREAVRKTLALRPEVVIMDILMPLMNGAEATAEIVRSSPGVKVLILTSFPDASDVVSALNNGAAGALTKTLRKEDLFTAIRDVAAGKKVLSEEIRQTFNENQAGDHLTPRQIAVLESLARGLTYEEIAQQLNVTKACIKFHVLTILRRLNVANRSEAVAIALRKHLLKI